MSPGPKKDYGDLSYNQNYSESLQALTDIKSQPLQTPETSHIDNILNKYLKDPPPTAEVHKKDEMEEERHKLYKAQSQEMDFKMSLNSDDFDLTHG